MYKRNMQITYVRHYTNVFLLFFLISVSVLFVPESSDNLVVSASADRSVLLHDLPHISSGQVSHVQKWECEHRVKKLAITNAFPKLFWSASEDGVLRFVLLNTCIII